MLNAAIDKNHEMMAFIQLYRDTYGGDVRFILDRTGFY